MVKKYGHRAIAIKEDVSKLVEIEHRVNQTVSDFGTIDILFCNVGVVNPIAPLHELSIKDWGRVITFNLRGIKGHKRRLCGMDQLDAGGRCQSNI